MSIKTEGFRSIIKEIQELADDDTLDAAIDAAAEQYKADMLSWIAQGRSFTSRTGRLLRSIKADTVSQKGISSITAGDNNPANARIRAQILEDLRQRDWDSARFNALQISGGGTEAWYAPFIEFGTYVSAGFPFFYADIQNRQDNAVRAAISVLDRIMTANP